MFHYINLSIFLHIVTCHDDKPLWDYLYRVNIISCAKFGCTMLKYYMNVRWWKFIKITAVIITNRYQYFTSLILLYFFWLT